MRTLLLLSCLFVFACSNPKAPHAEQPSYPITDLPSMSLEEAGFNRDSIEHLMRALAESPRRGDFRGMVVIKDNKLVLEEYFGTYWRKTVHDIRSAGKSVTALLLGIAIKEGLIKDLDQSVYSLFSEEKNPSINEDYQKIKLQHLLDMASGLDADTDDTDTPGHAVQWMAKDDWKSYLLNVPLKNKPGERFVYADIHPLLIGLAMEEASGMSLKDYAREKLFGPLGFEPVYWYTNPANQTGAAGNLYLTGFDFAKLGLLVANEGQWEGQQIINADYIEALKNSKGYPEVSDVFFAADSYGMLWYKSKRTFGNKEFEYLFASGSGGNHLIVVPEEELVIALLSTAYGPGHGQGRSYTVMSMILAALE